MFVFVFVFLLGAERVDKDAVGVRAQGATQTSKELWAGGLTVFGNGEQT